MLRISQFGAGSRLLPLSVDNQPYLQWFWICQCFSNGIFANGRVREWQWAQIAGGVAAKRRIFSAL
jgi:hypothetical protein